MAVFSICNQILGTRKKKVTNSYEKLKQLKVRYLSKLIDLALANEIQL